MIFSSRIKKRRCFFLTFILISIAASSIAPAASAAAAITALDASVNEQIIMLPVSVNGTALQLETTLFKPPGEGPFPLLLMNHGKDKGKPMQQQRDRFLSMSREFVKRGYAVAVPMRKGFSRSTGTYSDLGCNMKDNGQMQADDVEAALTSLVHLPWVDSSRILVAGQSYGGLAAMAFGTRHFPGVRGLLNFAGGLRIDGSSCDWKSSLVTAFASYAAKTSLPSLWFYGANDSYFDHPLAQRLQDAYQSAGGASQLISFASFKSDAHGLVGSRDGVTIWWPETERFLKQLGMPFDDIIPVADLPRPPASGFASVGNINAVPYMNDKGRTGYKEYLSKSSPRAFAISVAGAWSWAEEGDDPSSRALAACQTNSKSACQLYAIDDDVVWRDSTTAAPPLAAR